MDFSDRVTAKRKSYKASSKRHRRLEDGTVEYGDTSDAEGESVRGKLVRLKREVRELEEDARRKNEELLSEAKRREDGKAQRAAKKASEADKDTADDDIKAEGGDATADGLIDGQEVVELGKILDGISIAQAPRSVISGAQLTRGIGSASKTDGLAQNGHGDPATYTVTYAPDYEQNHTLTKAADFDSRLALLEKALGINAATLPGDAAPTAILPTLDTIQRQVSVLSESTPASLDGISRRVRTLTQEAERLGESRKAAKTAQDALKAAGGDVVAEEGEDSEQIAKVNALYGTLSTIEQLSPLLPALLDRLRSLRAIHADAATASESLGKIEQRQRDMDDEIKRWREGLEKVEEGVKENESVVRGNMKAVQGWVKDLEARMERL